MTVIFKNNAASTLAVQAQLIDTVLTVSAGTGNRFPTPAANEWFFATIQSGVDYEIVKCTARAGDVLTVVRAQDGTAARLWSAGVPIDMRIPKIVLESFLQEIADASVTTTKLADASVTTTKLADASVTTTKLADASVTMTKLDAAVFGQVVAKAGDTMTGALNYAPWVDVASAATTDIGAATSNNVRITGTTTITSLGTAASGVTRALRFAGALILTHNATSLILPGGANITTAAGDTATAISLGSGNWVVTDFMPANGWRGAPVVLAEAVANNSATLDITGVFNDTYDRYELELFNLLPAVNDGTMILRVGTGAGPTWQSGSSYNNAIFGITDASSGVAPSLTTAIYLSWPGGSGAGVSNVAATGGVSGLVGFCNPENSAIYPSFNVDTRHIYASGPRASSIRGAGIYADTAAVTGLRVLSSTGNLTSGSIRLIGYRK